MSEVYFNRLPANAYRMPMEGSIGPISATVSSATELYAPRVSASEPSLRNIRRFSVIRSSWPRPEPMATGAMLSFAAATVATGTLFQEVLSLTTLLQMVCEPS